jgi:hypothetical protein
VSGSFIFNPATKAGYFFANEHVIYNTRKHYKEIAVKIYRMIIALVLIFSISPLNVFAEGKIFVAAASNFIAACESYDLIINNIGICL